MILYKSDFSNFQKCPKKVWLTKFLPNKVSVAFDPYLSECGQIIGNRAKEWAKQFISPDIQNNAFEFLRGSSKNAVDHTLEHIHEGTPLLYESAFSHNEVYCRTDLLWNIKGKQIVGEVKSSTSVKDQDDAQKKYGLDLAVQYYAMTSAISESQLEVDSFQLILPDADKSQPGINGLTFKRIEMLDVVKSLQSKVNSMAEEIQEFLSAPYDPEINMGKHCKGCQFDANCRQGKHDLLAFQLPGFNGNWSKIPKLHKNEYPLEMQTPLKDIPDDLLKLPIFKRVQSSERNLQHFLDLDKSKEVLSEYEGPFGYLDFEYASPFPYMSEHGIPVGSRIPFQYVLYRRESVNSSLEEFPKYYLNLEDADPRRTFAEKLIKDCKGLQTIFVYGMVGAEGVVLKNLIKAFPDLEDELSRIHNSCCDLLDVVRENYYHPDMMGSYSLKRVLPTVGVTYDNLTIKGGQQAQLSYLFARYSPERLGKSIEDTKKDLMKYCGVDTFGMVKVHDFLLTGVGAVSAKPLALRGSKKMKSIESKKPMESSEDKDKKQFISKRQLFQIMGLVGIIFLIWLLINPVIYHFFGIPNSSAELGDSYGAVNSLFSALGLAGIILSIILQQNELSLTHKEVTKSAVAQTESAKALKKQSDLHILTTKIQALSVLIESLNQKITQNDRWNAEMREKKYDNTKVFQKRLQLENELWKLKEELNLFDGVDDFSGEYLDKTVDD
jgi:CRISPR/Cas system-associated exonuclease Cas4 (RecB family)